ncbi:hypothetical protein ANANG_G00166420 [Anguilla anguilla]|uniref:Neuronal PAS domain protein 4 n=1 Tax=Anguilla anguilla TaxID=7936 RepID=A0A9D3MC62_ANGAN|nr:hypothetical protein ANANG_G00166420 [Anguilla anguilla]
MYRSTKGASKARRDQINAEIRNLKELLPISEVDKARLSYLHIMSLACMYTRKSVFFSQETETTSGQEESSRFMSSQELSQLVQELPGFLLMLTSEGKLLYLSDSVTEHLGHSMVDLVAQGDSVYDIIDPTDHFVMRSNLSPTTSPDTDRLFRCRFNTSKSARRQSAGTRLTLVRALCLSTPGAAASSYWTSNPAWLCFCSPLESQPSSPGTRPTLAPPADHAFFLAGFHSRHGQDMRVRDADDSVSVYLGYDVEALRSRSWYSLVHPQDLPHASAQHCSLLSEGSEGRAEMVVRVEAQDGSFTWLYMVLHLETGESPISCRSYIVSESEAWSVRQQLCTEQTQLALVLSASASYQDSLGLRSPDTLSSPDQVFTPSSSGLSGQSFDFSAAASTSMSSSEELGGAAAADPMLEGPRSSLSSLEEEGLAQQGGPQQPPPPQSPATRPLGLRPHSTLTWTSSPGGLFGYALEGLLTPEASPTELPHPLEAQIQGEAGLEQERAEISYLAQQISTLAESFSSKLCSSSSPTPLPIAPPTKQDPISPLGEIYPNPRLCLPRPSPPLPRPVCLVSSPSLGSWSPWNPCLGQEPQLPPSWGNNLSCINSTVTVLLSTFSQMETEVIPRSKISL